MSVKTVEVELTKWERFAILNFVRGLRSLDENSLDTVTDLRKDLDARGLARDENVDENDEVVASYALDSRDVEWLLNQIKTHKDHIAVTASGLSTGRRKLATALEK